MAKLKCIEKGEDTMFFSALEASGGAPEASPEYQIVPGRVVVQPNVPV